MLFIILFSLQNCNSDKKEGKVEKSEPKDTTTVKANGDDQSPVFKLPIFEVSRTEVEKYYGTGKKNPKKFVIRVEFGDITETTSQSSMLLLYPAKDHKEYAGRQTPLEVPATSTLSEDLNSNVIVGSIEFDGAGKLLNGGNLKEFDVIRFTPKIVKGDDNRDNHLTFNVTLISPQKAVIEDLGDANPSPPKPPSYN